jgi:hypothetical protein
MENFTNSSIPINMITDDFGIVFELSLFASNIKKEVWGVLDFFLSFSLKYEKRKVHNMLTLMLGPRFKNFRFILFYFG